MNIKKIKKFYKSFEEKIINSIEKIFNDTFNVDEYVRCYNSFLYNYTGIENYATLKSNNPKIYEEQLDLTEDLLYRFKEFPEKQMIVFIEEKFKNDQFYMGLIGKIPRIKNSKVNKISTYICYYVMLEAINVITKKNPTIFD